MFKGTVKRSSVGKKEGEGQGLQLKQSASQPIFAIGESSAKKGLSQDRKTSLLPSVTESKG